MTSALALRQVSKVYGSGPTEVHALSAVDLAVERSELVAVMGPSGSVRSAPISRTSLNSATKLAAPASGSKLCSRRMHSFAASTREANSRRSYIKVSTSSGLYDHLRHFVRHLLSEAAETGDVRDDVLPDELANYCLHALSAASSLPSKTAVRRLVTVTLAGLRPLH